MNLEALFKISHGVYITGATDDQNRKIGSCIDSVMVVEAEPAQIMISMNNQSYTCENVLKNKKLTLSVLEENAPLSLIEKFGMQSSRTVNKWADTPHHEINGMPVLDQAVSMMELQVIQTQETKGHKVFLCQVVQIKEGTMGTPLTYNDYQNKKRKEKTMSEEKKWVCSVCGYVYDGDVPFEELPEDWVCPLCGEPKSVFVQE